MTIIVVYLVFSPIFEHHGGLFMNAVNSVGSAVGFGPQPVLQPVPTAAPNPSKEQNLQNPTRVRSVFPETWLWSNSTTGY